jgi:hypothetical protein
MEGEGVSYYYDLHDCSVLTMEIMELFSRTLEDPGLSKDLGRDVLTVKIPSEFDPNETRSILRDMQDTITLHLRLIRDKHNHYYWAWFWRELMVCRARRPCIESRTPQHKG